MRVLLFAVFFLASSLQMISGQEKVITGKNVVMFGNSITYHGKWDEVLGRTDVVNWGIPGYTTGQLVWTIKNVLHDYPGTKIWFIEGGINDITLGVPVDRIFENQKVTIDSLRRNNIIPVLQSTILVSGDKGKNRLVKRLNNKNMKYCRDNGIEYIDLNSFLSRDGELIKELSTDGCHLKPDSYKPWVDAVRNVLSKYNI